MQAYHAEKPASFLVLPEDEGLAAFECGGSRLPDFNGPYADVYVWPADAGWTMAFTHEATLMDLGPYFSRREWVEESTIGGGAV